MVRSASSRVSNHEARANSSFETALTRLLGECEGYGRHPEELEKQASRRMDATRGLAAILRDARKGALLRMRSEIYSQPLRMRSVPLKLSCDRGQHRKQRGAVGGSQQLVETRFVLGGDELLRPSQHRPALVGQDKDVGAAIVGGAYPLAQIAVLQPVEHRHEIRPENAERIGDFGLVASRILVEQQHHRELRRRQLQWRDTAQKILEDFQLRALERIAQMLGQL